MKERVMKPIDVRGVELPGELLMCVKDMADKVYEVRVKRRMDDGGVKDRFATSDGNRYSCPIYGYTKVRKACSRPMVFVLRPVHFLQLSFINRNNN